MTWKITSKEKAEESYEKYEEKNARMLIKYGKVVQKDGDEKMTDEMKAYAEKNYGLYDLNLRIEKYFGEFPVEKDSRKETEVEKDKDKNEDAENHDKSSERSKSNERTPSNSRTPSSNSRSSSSSRSSSDSRGNGEMDNS